MSSLDASSEIPETSIHSAIGQKFGDTPRAAVSLAVFTVAADFALVTHGIYGDVRACTALVAFALTIYLTDGDHKSIGLSASPKQGWSSWASTSLKIGAATGVCVVGGLGIWSVSGHELTFPTTAPADAFSRFLHMCFVAPVVEETVYRVAACGLIATICGNKRTILINGLLFGGLHFLYGNASPENMVGGFFLAWAFLKSETILIPILLHSIGNTLVLTGQVAGWYLLGGAG